MRVAFSIRSIASPLYRATNSPFFASSSKYRPRPALGILDLAIFIRLGLLLGLGCCRDLDLFGLLALVTLHLPVLFCDCCLAAATCRALAVMLRVFRLVILWFADGGVSNFGIGADSIGGGVGVGHSASLSLLLPLLSKTAAAASFHVGMGGILIVLWILGVGVTSVDDGVDVGGEGGGVELSTSLSLLLSKIIAAASAHVGMRGVLAGVDGSGDIWIEGEAGVWILGVGVTSVDDGVDVVGEGGGVELSTSLSLLLSKTFAAASAHVGMRGILAGVGGSGDIWIEGEAGVSTDN